MQPFRPLQFNTTTDGATGPQRKSKLTNGKGRGRSANDGPQEISAWHGTVGAAVHGVQPIVAQHEVLVLAAQDQLIPILGIAERRCARSKIRLVQFAPVEVHGPVLQIDRISRRGNDSLDRKAVVAWVAKDHHVAVPRRMDVIDPAVQKVVLGIVKGGHHAPADYAHRLEKEPADEQEAGRGEDQHRETLKTLPENQAKIYSGLAREREGCRAGRGCPGVEYWHCGAHQKHLHLSAHDWFGKVWKIRKRLPVKYGYLPLISPGIESLVSRPPVHCRSAILRCLRGAGHRHRCELANYLAQILQQKRFADGHINAGQWVP